MANGLKIVAIALIVLGLFLGGGGAFLMFSYVPGLLDDAELPDDTDKHYFYGGYVSKLDTSTGMLAQTDFVADRHVTYESEADGGHALVRSEISGILNGTTTEIPDLYSDTVYEVHPKELTLYNVDIQGGSKEGYNRDIAGSEGVNYVFPIPPEKVDYQIWSSDNLNWTTAYYLGTEDRGGVECYLYKGEIGDLDDPADKGYEVPLPDSLASLLGPFAEDTKFYLKGWEKAWVHSTTGSIVDYAKELRQYLYLPELPPIPEIIYPSDLMSSTGFEGTIMLFDQATGTFNTLSGATAERMIEVVSDEGYVYTANETLNVYDPLGSKIDLLSSAVQVMFNATDGTHAGMGRSGNYLFPPSGVEMKDYMIWDDGFGKELTASYVGNKTFGDLTAYEYMINVVNDTYLAGGVASMEMTYWVEVVTGMVLDVDKKVVNWRPQPARRLPLDTALINKTVNMNTTITQTNPINQSETTMEIVGEQMINCTGYTDATFAVAMIEETVTKYYMGAPMSAPTVSKFGVDAVTMEYVYIDGWSTVNRTGGVFTFPLGILNETDELPASFVMFNSDLGAVMPAVFTEEVVFNGLDAAVYTMALSDYPLDYDQLVAALSGNDPGIPGASGLYAGSTVYTVDIDTGTILDVQRMMNIKIVPPTYEYLWDNLMSQSVLVGDFDGDNITVTQTLIGYEAGDGTTLINMTKTYAYDNGTEFLPIEYGEALINTTSHEMYNETMDPQDVYLLFPANPTAISAYPQMYMMGGEMFTGAAMLTTQDNSTASYTFSDVQVIDAGMFGAPAGLPANMTLEYNYLLDKVSGMVLDVNVHINVENNSQGLNMDIDLVSDNDPVMIGLGNKVMGWAVSEMPAEVLDVEMELYDMEVAYNVGKATVMQGLFDVADGDKPALDLHLMFNATTKATMMATAQGTISLLEQLEGLKTLYGLNTVLGMYGNKVAHVYYKQLDEEPAGYDWEGSVKYHGDEAKAIDDTVSLMGTTVPIVLFVVMVVFILVGIALIFAGPKGDDDEEEDEEEPPVDEEESAEEGDEGVGEE